MGFVYESLLWCIIIFLCNILADDQKVPHQLFLVVKISLEHLSDLEYLLVVPSHTKNKIGNRLQLHVTLIDYLLDERYIFPSEKDK